MKTIHKIIGLLLLVLIGYQLTTIEGYPSNSSFTVPTTGIIPDTVLDQIKIGHYSVMFMKNGSKINNKLNNLFNAGLTPGLIIYIPPSIHRGSKKYNRILRTLRKTMQLPSGFILSEGVVYVHSQKTNGYMQYYGRCNNRDFKLDREGTNCG